MKKILYIVPTLSAGGIESFVCDLSENLNKTKYEIHVATFNPNNAIHKDRLEKNCVKIHFISDAGSSDTILNKILWRFKAIVNYNRLLSKYKFDVVHCHNFLSYHWYILIAKLKKIPIRIIHCHTAGSEKEDKLKYTIRRIKNSILFEKLATHRIGCSNVSAKWMFGNKSIENRYAMTIYNGVNGQRFCEEPYVNLKDKIKNKYKIDNRKINFIHIGRFCIPKNQIFLIKIFNKLIKYDKSIHLHIVGEGPLEKDIKNQISDLNMNDNVTFYSSKTDIAEIMSVMDFFILPSKWEGFPVTAIEAQFMNLETFLSDKITDEVNMGLCNYISIEDNEIIWAEKIINIIKNRTKKYVDADSRKYFDIRNISKQFEDIYDLGE